VHAIHETAPMAPMLPFVDVETLEEVGRRVAATARQLVHDLTEREMPVETLVHPGSRTHVLCEAGEDARMVVLGHRDRSVLGRVFTSSTTTGVAARAHCPVVCVPAIWTDGHESGRVVAGLDGSPPSRDALALAFAAAAERKAHLTVLHAWKLSGVYDDIISPRLSTEGWRESALEQMEQIIAECRSANPEVDVDVDLRHQYPAPALVGATEGADLIVLGRRGHGAPLGVYLGSIARTLIREARCPVEIAPHQPHRKIAEQRAARSGEMSPRRR
jgi:nucleotide-binding universal stress UspA family protein